MDYVFSQHDLSYLDDIMPEKDKKKKEDEKKKKKKKGSIDSDMNDVSLSLSFSLSVCVRNKCFSKAAVVRMSHPCVYSRIFQPMRTFPA